MVVVDATDVLVDAMVVPIHVLERVVIPELVAVKNVMAVVMVQPVGLH